jgi:N-carbamoyl-L-amino-acid hydrolase
MHEIIEAGLQPMKTRRSRWSNSSMRPVLLYDAACLDSVRAAAAQFDYPHMEMVSGAGHDACNVSEVAPTAMIFIPCEGGISHNEAEHIETEHATAGANILLHSVLHQAGR